MILYDLWRVMDHATLEEQLRGSWAANVLEGMQAHHEALQNAQRACVEWNSPAAVQERRDQKRRLKQEQHVVRLAAKVEWDRHWLSQQASESTEES